MLTERRGAEPSFETVDRERRAQRLRRTHPTSEAGSSGPEARDEDQCRCRLGARDGFEGTNADDELSKKLDRVVR